MLEGDGAAALKRLRSGAFGFERAGRPLLAGDAWCDVLESARQCGDSSAADHAARSAGQLAERHGCARLAARLTGLGVAADGAAADWVTGRGLSRRETEIARLVADGHTNREIGRRLFISEHTVRNQLVQVFAKLGVTRRAEIVRLGARPPADPRD
jgi:DNA-binding CsgD family transcriptional regulator